MFINNVSANGNNTEGIGSVLSFKLISYAMSTCYGLKFVDNKFQNIIGAEFIDLSNDEYIAKINEYFSFNYKNTKKPESIAFDIFFDYSNKKLMSKNKLFFLTNKRKFLEERFTSNIKKIQKKNILTELSNDIPIDPSEKYFKEGLNITIHLRTALPEIDIRFEPSREYFYGSYYQLDTLNNFIHQLEHSDNLNKLNFHIITAKKNKMLEKVYCMFDKNSISIHEDLDVFDSFSLLVHSDIMLGTTSNLSYTAHLLRDKTNIFPKNTSFGGKSLYKNVIRLDQYGFIEKLNLNTNFRDLI
jgi:hypothetical protein